MMDEAEIIFDIQGAMGLVTLNRPKALNAVTHDMVRQLWAQLHAWENDARVAHVVVRASGDRAFSAGGDIRVIYDAIREGRQSEVIEFWREEYRLNHYIKHYPKPYISFIDGIVMGGGVGVCVHGSHRIAGDKFLFAMPEVGIGFFPDVGATYFLPRLPGEIGTWCALTGDRLKAGDGVNAQVATHYVPSVQQGAAIAALAQSDDVDETLARFAQPIAPGPMMSRAGILNRTFKGDSVEQILDQLGAEARAGGPDAAWADETRLLLLKRPPLSLRIALAQMRRGKAFSFAEAIRCEFRIVTRMANNPDFIEGIRATIIDKDNAPRWQHAGLSQVSADVVDAYFAPRAGDELQMP